MNTNLSSRVRTGWLAVLFLGAVAVASACGDSSTPTDNKGGGSASSSSNTTKSASSSSSTSFGSVDADAGVDGSTDAGAADCIPVLKTPNDILNAAPATGVQKIVKAPDLSKFLVDGGLPALPN